MDPVLALAELRPEPFLPAGFYMATP